jgi:hypothetical protein
VDDACLALLDCLDDRHEQSPPFTLYGESQAAIQHEEGTLWTVRVVRTRPDD